MIAASVSPWIRVAAISGASAVGLGAYGAHALNPTDPKFVKVYERGNTYHLLHSFLLAAAPHTRRPHIVGGLSTIGIVLFSGSCYAAAITENTAMAKFAPIGGTSLIAAWLALAL